MQLLNQLQISLAGLSIASSACLAIDVK